MGRKSKNPKTIAGRQRYREFRKLAEYAAGLLEGEGRGLLEIKLGDGNIDFVERLVRRRKWDRYLPPESQKDWDQKRERVRWVLDRLSFLFGSEIPDHIIGHLVTEAVLDVATLGSQSWHLKTKTLEWRGRRRGNVNPIQILHIQHPCVKKFRRHVPMLRGLYPQLMPENLVRDLGRNGVDVFNTWWISQYTSLEDIPDYYVWVKRPGIKFTFFDQLTFRYSYYLFKVYREEDYADWFYGLMKRHRWHLEKIALTAGSWSENKYREGFLRLLSEELTGDLQRSKYQDCVFLLKKRGQKKVTIDKDEGAERTIETVLGCFGEEQLRLLESKDSRGNPWSFERQMRDRFSYRRPSFAALEEVEEHVRRKVSMYGLLINGKTAEVIGDILLDDFDQELFLSEATYRWNQEMGKEESGRANAKVLWAIDRILKSIDASLLEKLPSNLKTLLLSRWKRALLAGSRKRFRRFLDELHIHTIHCPHYWTKENLSSVDLQAFLGQLDPMFLYPREGRIFKLLGNRNDVGLALGRRRDGRYLPFNPFAFLIYFPFLMVCLMVGFAAKQIRNGVPMK